MAEAVIKVSWRSTPSGKIIAGFGAAEGGICGTCFTVASGITISCAHNMSGLFVPNKGFDKCQVFVAERSGKVTELHDGCVQLFPEYDACTISGFSAEKRYIVGSKEPAQVSVCDLHGYRANTGPFQCGVRPDGAGIQIQSAAITSVAQNLIGLTPRLTTLDIQANDMHVTNKYGYTMQVAAEIGLSGGPMLDGADGTVIGLCFFGLPADVHHKTHIGAIDIRQFRFI